METEVSLGHLDAFARQFWQYAGEARVFAFHGEMGAGKTTLITALCQFKGVYENMSSPTFSIINEYAFQQNEETKTIYHIDLYRLKDEEEVIRAGVEDCLYSGAICLVEWPEIAAHLFDENTVHVYVETAGAATRKLRMELPA
jgi:tRNA threonylcarbamoyladenosine biosynthesis protein TsaE